MTGRTTLIALALLMSACAPAPADMADRQTPSALATPSATPSPRLTATTEPTESAAPTPAALPVDQLARVVVDALAVHQDADRDSTLVREVCFDSPEPCPPVVFGKRNGMVSVYLLDGPLRADGYDWYLAADNTDVFPVHVGWIAAGDANAPWIVPATPKCPDEPVRLADITFAAMSQLEVLACVGDRELTLRGWYPAPPEDVGGDSCKPLPDRRFFCAFTGYEILRPVKGPWVGSADHLPWIIDSAAGLRAPENDTWITIRGQFDHPAARRCYDGNPSGVLGCRLDFVVSSIDAG